MGLLDLILNGKEDPENLRNQICEHMGTSCVDAQSISYQPTSHDCVSIRLVLEEWGHRNGSRLLGISDRHDLRKGIAELVTKKRWVDDEESVAPVVRSLVNVSHDEKVDCIIFGLVLLHFDSEPVTVLVTNDSYRPAEIRLELLANSRVVAQAALKRLQQEAEGRNVYRGKVVSLESDSYDSSVIRFHDIPTVSKSEIILPEKVLDVVERNVPSLIQHAAVLKRAGRSTRHGLLLHGPPGTGKSLAIRYLLSVATEHTVLLLTAANIQLLKDCCNLARLLSPSIVVIEDVDLVAEARYDNHCPRILNELFNEMDGLDRKAEVIFVLTTNRPDVLEPALAGRPGRVSQAIEFPLPDEQCRTRLFELYGNGLDLSHTDLPSWIAKTDGVSPAFIEELLKKSTLMAAERGEDTDPLVITDSDIDKAVRELVYFGGTLTQKLLGFGSGSKLGFRPGGDSENGTDG